MQKNQNMLDFKFSDFESNTINLALFGGGKSFLKIIFELAL